MIPPKKPQKEHPSTYMVQDRANQDESRRVTIQDRLLTSAMGGALPEQSDTTLFQQILDVGCGTGGWLLEVAKICPTATLLVGVDISSTILEFAREQARDQHVEDRVEFRTMDALRMLEFPNASFDLVNQRLGSSYLRTWDWDVLLPEYRRVCRPDGVLRITESNVVTESNSAAYVRFNQLILEALNQAGHYFTPTPDGVTGHLSGLLQKYGFQNVQTRTHQIDYHVGTPQAQWYFEDAKRATETLLPFLRKWIRLPADYDSLCQQMLSDMQQPDFTAYWRLLTVWGTNASSREVSSPA